MEQSIFLVKENDCEQFDSNKEEWDVVNQPIVCYLNAIGIEVFRISRRQTEFKYNIVDICNFTNIKLSIESIEEFEAYFSLKLHSKNWTISKRPDDFLKDIVAVCNHFLDNEKIAIISINRNKAYFFKERIEFINQFFDFCNQFNQNVFNSIIFRRYEIDIFEIKNDIKILLGGHVEEFQNTFSSKKAIIDPTTLVQCFYERNKDAKSDLSFNSFDGSLLKFVYDNNLSNIYIYSLNSDDRVYRFFREIEILLNILPQTFEVYLLSQTNLLLRIENNIYDIVLGSHHDFEKTIFYLINRYLSDNDFEKQIFCFSSSNQGRQIILNNEKRGTYFQGFVLMPIDIGQKIVEHIKNTYSKIPTSNYIDFLYNLNANIDYEWDNSVPLLHASMYEIINSMRLFDNVDADDHLLTTLLNVREYKLCWEMLSDGITERANLSFLTKYKGKIIEIAEVLNLEENYIKTFRECIATLHIFEKSV